MIHFGSSFIPRHSLRCISEVSRLRNSSVAGPRSHSSSAGSWRSRQIRFESHSYVASSNRHTHAASSTRRHTHAAGTIILSKCRSPASNTTYLTSDPTASKTDTRRSGRRHSLPEERWRRHTRVDDMRQILTQSWIVFLLFLVRGEVRHQPSLDQLFGFLSLLVCQIGVEYPLCLVSHKPEFLRLLMISTSELTTLLHVVQVGVRHKDHAEKLVVPILLRHLASHVEMIASLAPGSVAEIHVSSLQVQLAVE
mmetsp:Transcript_475/g.691  ORF Transcript_475/g.691 Transcript_475/m.691 type:complete len:252 (-) Transcript_475:553-1308(-)